MFLTLIGFLKVVLINVIAMLMMSAKMAALDFKKLYFEEMAMMS